MEQAKTPIKDIANHAREHYEKAWRSIMCWNSTIPQAIDLWEKHHQKIEDGKAGTLEAQRDAAIARAEEAEAEAEQLKSQLPDGMKHCTIRFIECEKGHGRLTADNWIDSGCLCCRIDEIEAKRDKLRAALEAAEWYDWHCPWCGGMEQEYYDGYYEGYEERGLKIFHTRGHKPDCQGQAALQIDNTPETASGDERGINANGV